MEAFKKLATTVRNSKYLKRNEVVITENRLFFNYYRIKDFNTNDFVKEGESYWEHSEITDLKPSDAPSNFKTGGMLGKMNAKMLSVNDSKDDEDEPFNEKQNEGGRPDVLYAHDHKLEELTMIVMGEKG